VVCRDRWGGPAGDVYGLVLSPGGEWVARATTANGQRAISAPAGPGWHHVALTYDGRALRLYVDGTQAARAALAGALAVEPDTPLAFCTYSGGANGRLAGALRSVGVWHECLSEAQVSALAAAWRREVTAAQAAGFRFAQASDTHVTDTRSVEIVNAAVDRINAEQDIAFSLWLGDLTQNSTADQMVLARLALQRLAKPHYVLRGNHDSSGGHFEKEFGALRRRIDYGGWVFLLADSNPGDKTPLSETDRDWLQEQLATVAPETPIVLCTHHPLMPHTRSYLLAGSEQVLALFDRHALKACLSGHYHGNQQETVNGVLFTTTACLATTRNNFDGTQAKGYRVFECRDGTISTTFVPVTDE
jgi:predicted MPP superfamily phosphohydrolase